MSNNYYWTPPKTSPLHLLAPIHIGKHSVGWAFTFKGYHLDDNEPGINEPGTIPEVPVVLDELRLVVISWKDWKELLSVEDTAVFDEGGEEVPVLTFIANVETHFHPTLGKSNGKELLNLVPQLRADVQNSAIDQFNDEKQYWMDEESFSFCNCEFS